MSKIFLYLTLYDGMKKLEERKIDLASVTDDVLNGSKDKHDSKQTHKKRKKTSVYRFKWLEDRSYGEIIVPTTFISNSNNK